MTASEGGPAARAPSVAIVGGGWAGLAAAVHAVERGWQVTVFESSRHWGGRARSLALPGVPGELDNGQHILIGAYVETLDLLQKVGVDPAASLLRLPLTLRFPDGGGLQAPDWQPPFDAVAAILRARGWSWGDRIAFVHAALQWQRAGFACAPTTTVAALTARLPPRVLQEVIEPLCVSALNTPARRASGAVFLRVLRDALFERGWGGWGGSNLLVPRLPLGALFPEAAARWIAARGARLRLGERVAGLAAREGGTWLVGDEAFDAVLLACPPWEAARLVAVAGVARAWVRAVEALEHEPIATVYASGGPRLDLPLLALRTGWRAPAQFVFDRSQLGGPSGLLAFVVSASDGTRESIESAVLAQATALGWDLQPVGTVVEKRATFACTPALSRPAAAIAPGLIACGDYVEGPYPATLEGAVRSAAAAVRAWAAAPAAGRKAPSAS